MNSQKIKTSLSYCIVSTIISFGLAFSVNAMAETIIKHGPQSKNANALMKRSEQLESEIARRQRVMQGTKDASAARYEQGFRDGYNKAVLDLVKSKLLPADPNAATKLSTVTTTQPIQNASPANKSNSFFWIDKSVASLHGQQWQLAIEAANEAIKADSHHIAPYINRSWGYAEKGFMQRALADANQAILINPKNALAYNNRAYAHELSGQIIEAKIDYQQACNFNYKPACDTSLKIASAAATDISAQVAMLLSQSYDKFQNKDWDAVENITTRILNLDPNNTVAYVNRSGARTELGKLDFALNDSVKALQLNPEFGIAHNNQAYIYEVMGKSSLAASSYAAACDLGVKQSCSDQRRLSGSQ